VHDQSAVIVKSLHGPQLLKSTRAFRLNLARPLPLTECSFQWYIPAEAITIDNSQGATYSKVVVHTSPGMQRAAL